MKLLYSPKVELSEDARKILIAVTRLAMKHEIWHDEMQRDGRVNIDDDPGEDMWHLVLDACGIPKEGESDYDRGGDYMVFEITTRHMDAEGFIDYLIGKRSYPESFDDATLEKLWYPNEHQEQML